MKLMANVVVPALALVESGAFVVPTAGLMVVVVINDGGSAAVDVIVDGVLTDEDEQVWSGMVNVNASCVGMVTGPDSVMVVMSGITIVSNWRRR